MLETWKRCICQVSDADDMAGNVAEDDSDLIYDDKITETGELNTLAMGK